LLPFPVATGDRSMRIILGAVLIFGAAWLMVRLQAKGGCCGQQEENSCLHGNDDVSEKGDA